MEYQQAQMINAIIERLDIIIQQNQIIIKTLENETDEQAEEEAEEERREEEAEIDEKRTGIKNIAREKVKVKS